MTRRGWFITAVLSALLLCMSGVISYAQSADPQSKRNKRKNPPPVQPQEVKRYKVVGGILTEVGPEALKDSLKQDPAAALILSDSLLRQVDSLRITADKMAMAADSLVSADTQAAMHSDSLRLSASALIQMADSLQAESDRILSLIPSADAVVDSLLTQVPALPDSLAEEVGELTKRELRRLQRETERADTSIVRYSPIFRDTVPISRMTAISIAVPGFSQLHNKQYWKIPVLYGAVGTALYCGFQQNKCYKKAKNHYDDLVFNGYDRTNSDMDYTQRVMIKYNTRRQLLFGAAAAAYIYFLGDGVMNYPGETKNVKIATTLSTICPGAGQIYNGSYWKVPIVVGAFSTMVMMIDWNNRGYERFKLAYNLKAAGLDDSVEPSLRNRPQEELLNYRKAYRRNRDLCIILTGVVYLVNIVDAHVDAHMKNFDISDDLNITLKPSVTNVTTRKSGNTNAMGFSLNLTF